MTNHSQETNVATKTAEAVEPSVSAEAGSKGLHKKQNAALLVVVLILLFAFLLLNLHWVAAVPNYQAQTQLNARNLSGAEWWLGVAQGLSPYNAETEYLLGRLRRQQGELNDADEHLSVAQDLGFAEDMVARERQLVSLQQGNLPEDPNLVTRLVNDTPWDSAAIYEAFVIGTMKSQDIALAQQSLYEWMQMFADDPRPHYYLALGAREFQDWRQAEDAFRFALQLDPTYHKATIGLADVLLITEQFDDAIKLFRAAEMSPGEKHNALIGQATCLRMKGDAAAARTLVTSVLAERPDMKSGMIEMAYLELDAGKFENARRLIEPHLVAEARNYVLNRAYGAALRGCGEEEQAKKYLDIADVGEEALGRTRSLEKLITGKPDDLQYRYDLGAIHLDYGSEQQGLAWLKNILEETPAHPPTLKKLAEYYESKQDERPGNAAFAKEYRDRFEKSRSKDDGTTSEVKDDSKTDKPLIDPMVREPEKKTTADEQTTTKDDSRK